MSKSKKYDYKITEVSASCWKASIIRHVSSTRTNVSKEQSDFTSEAEAKTWAEAQLDVFSQAQAKRNVRKNEQRKINQAQREDRSSRNAAKTAAAKAEKLEGETTPEGDVWGKQSADVSTEDAAAESTTTSDTIES